MTAQVDWGEDPPPEVNITYKFRRGSAARWLEVDPVLGPSEPGHETDTGRLKLGDGVSKWSELPYLAPTIAEGGGGSSDAIFQHINDPTPHPVYDDGPSLLLLYQNAKV